MRTLVDLLRGSVERYRSLPALTLYGGKGERWTWTYGRLWDEARRVAAHLHDAGVGKGDRVVLWGPNRPEWVAAFFGAQLLGAVVVPLDLRSPEDLLTRIEEQTTPKHLVIGHEQAARLERPHAPHTCLEDLSRVVAGCAPWAVDAGQVAPEDIAELVFTSGTTGNPKGVILTHRNVVANAQMSRAAVDPTPRHRVLSILPLSHMFEQQGGLFVPLIGGASISYVGSLRPDVIFDAMNRARITNMTCVPQVLELFREGIEREVRRQGRARQFALLHRLALRLPLAARRILFRRVIARMGGAFEFFVSGGAYLDPALARWWEGLGIKVVQGYGATEAAPVLAANSVDDRDQASVGRPLPGVQLRIADDGEILVRGDNITPGYWQNPEATAEAFVDGWYRTGDIGYLDEAGRLHLQSRKKNVIVLANGMNVYPEDIERALTAEPGVKDAAVFGLTEGQDVVVHAVLVLDGRPEDAAGIVRRANARLGPQQRIRGFTVWPDESFPLTPTLKAKRLDILDRLPQLRAAEQRSAS
jgi:long-chain acyl-CoA synthetase